MCVLSIKFPIQKKSENLFNDPRIIPEPGSMSMRGAYFSVLPVVSPGKKFEY